MNIAVRVGGGLLSLWLVAASFPQSAFASQVVVTITGIVASGSMDESGVFGPPNTSLEGKSFVLTFTFDDTRGTPWSEACSDGTILESAISGADASNPGTAVLQIAGRSFVFGGGTLNQNSISSYASRIGAIHCAGNPYPDGAAGFGLDVSYGPELQTPYSGSSSLGFGFVGFPPTALPAPGTVLSYSGDWRSAIFSAPLNSDDAHTFPFNIAIYGPTNFLAYGHLSQQFLSVSGPLPASLQFVPVVPCRVADTRNSSGPFGGPEMTANSSRDFSIPSSACNIPSNAAAYSLNVTVVPDAQLGYLTIWPTGQPQPFVSTLNSDGRIKANAAIVPAGGSGAVSVYVTDSTQVILDIDGYFVPSGNSSSALDFYPLPPCRIADTRQGNGPFGGPYLSAGQPRSFPMLSSGCNIPSGAQAYSLNFTVVPHVPLGYLTTWPTGLDQPLVSTLNASTGTVAANAAIVPAGTDGDISVYVSDDTDLVIDINGYFASPAAGGLSLYTLVPCRVLDTRNPAGSPPFSGTLAVNLMGSTCGAPPSAQAYVMNATVVPPGPLTYLTLWPDGQAQPFVSTSMPSMERSHPTWQ